MHENNTVHERSHGEEAKQQQHAKSVMPIVTALKFFLKGGRRISIGDCALFQAGKAPPFIGILRNASLDKEGVVKLAVNWLYRPADVKLAKGAPFEAAPNEIFYSFHKDDIPATALLHPCRVAFLPKGVELPSGVSSFVCRRVYDTTNKRLWWLTDKDYTDEHQQEVDLLLGRIEMQAAVQAEIPSPKALAGPSFQQAKGSTDNAQTPAVAAAKGKKRERVDPNLEPSKRERLVKPEDSESDINKQDCSMKAEDISAITDKDGSILNLACVDKLIVLMHQERNDGVKKLADLASRRSVLAGVIAATDREDCLNRFVQLGGLPVLDDWLQEAHKGKVGDGGSPKDGDKVFEDLLLILLRALDKLPVNLDALKTCIVGKSVNNLRSHKNIEIQKKARKLVDIWKKRVEAEMKQSGEGKVGQGMPWSCKQPPTDSLHSNSIKNGGSSDVAVKSSGGFVSSPKATSNSTGNVGDGVSKPTVLVPLHGKTSPSFSSSLPGIKDSYKLPNSNISADVSGKEDKSSSPSYSQNHVSHWSNISVKSSSSALLNSKVPSLVPRSTGISSKGLVGQTSHGSQKEALGGKLLVCSRNNAVSIDKLANATAMSEKGVCESGNIEHPGSQRLMVKIPNPVRSPLHVGIGGTVANAPPNLQEMIVPLVMSDLPEGKTEPGSNPPTVTETEGNSILRGCNTSICVVMDGDTNLHSFVTPLEDRNEGQQNGEKICESSKKISLSAEVQCIADETHLPARITLSAQKSTIEGLTEADKSGKYEKFSQVNRPAEGIPAQPETTGLGINDGPMGLLATVAAGETATCQGTDTALISVDVQKGQQRGDVEVQGACAAPATFESDSAHTGHANGCREGKVVVDDQSSKYMSHSLSPATSSSGNNQSLEDSRNRLKSLKEQSDGAVRQSVSQTNSGEDGGDILEEKSCTGALSTEQDAKSPEHMLEVKQDSPSETREVPLDAGDMEMDDYKKAVFQLYETNVTNLRDPSCGSMNRKSDSDSEDSDGTGSEKSLRFTQNLASDLEQFIGRSSDSDASEMESNSGSPEEDALEVARQVAKEVEQEMERYSKPLGSASSDMEMQDANVLSTHESVEVTINNLDLASSGHDLGEKINMEAFGQSEIAASGCAHNEKVIGAEQGGTEKVTRRDPDLGGEAIQSASCTGASSAVVAVAIDGAESNVPKIEDLNYAQTLNVSGELEISGTSNKIMQPVASTSFMSPSLSGSNLSAVDSDVAKASELKLQSVDPITYKKATGPIAGDDAVERPVFDLNEGFITEDGMQEELTSCISAHVTSFSTTPAVHSVSSNGLTAPIAVVASTNGSFIPPPSPVHINKDYGWKGSAATSAFRPAEPRRTSELQNSMVETTLADPTCASATKRFRAPLDIDLNVADDRMIEDTGIPMKDGFEGSASKISAQATALLFTNLSSARSANDGCCSSALQPLAHISSRPDLDLNRVDESDGDKELPIAESIVTENLSSLRPHIHVTSSVRNVMRDFDLNDGPVASFEDVAALDEPVQQHFSIKNCGSSSTPAVPGLRMTGEMVNVAPWFLPGNSFSAVTIPAFAGTRAESPYPMATAQPFLGAGIGLTPFSTDIFRAGAAITSSPAVAFPAAPPGPYPYPGFPFGASFPLGSNSLGATSTLYGDATSSASFPSVSSQTVNSGGLPHAFVGPPYLKGLPEGAGTESNAVWGRLAFDLNAGPDSVDSEVVREDGLNVSRHPFILNNNQQMGAFRQVGASGGVPKRKGPEGGWEAYRSGYKHPTWR